MSVARCSYHTGDYAQPIHKITFSTTYIGLNMKSKLRDFYVFVERDEDGYYVGEVPQLRGCYSQGETLDDLMANIKEVIELCLEDEENYNLSEFIGIQKVSI